MNILLPQNTSQYIDSKLHCTMRFFLVVIAWLATIARPAPVDAYNFLLIPTPAKSHVYTMIAVADELQFAGHRATILLTENFQLRPSDFQQNRSDIRIVRYADHSRTGLSFRTEETYDRIAMAMMDQRTDDSFFVKMIRDVGWCDDDSCGWLRTITDVLAGQGRELMMHNDELFERLNQEKFDLAAIDGNVFTRYFFLVPHRLRIPWVSLVLQIEPWVVRTPWLPSFVPHMATPFTDRMTFLERLQNTVMNVVNARINKDPPSDIFKKYQSYGSFVDLNDLASRSLMYFYTQDSLLDYSAPIMPNMVRIGGLTIKRDAGHLPRDIEEFMDGAEQGTIVVSFGTMASTFHRQVVEKFAAVFGRLDGYRIVWRLNNVDGVSLPANVLIRPWLPQYEILAHPSVRLFLTHAGNNGQLEAMYHGVPMLAFPMLGDQIWNARRAEYKGYGKSMTIASFTADELYANVRLLIDDPSYVEKVRKASEIFRSQPQKPAERAVYWLEHVCRFGGDHLRSAGDTLPIYAYFMLDIVAFVLVILVVVILLTYKVLVWLYGKCWSSKMSQIKIKPH